MTLSSYCNNCGKYWHTYRYCKLPITSIGIINVRKDPDALRYLMICRKHSLGFVEFMRGRYSPHNLNYMVHIFDEMTIQEKVSIVEQSFDMLWRELWGDNIEVQYHTEEKISRDKFNMITQGIYIRNEFIDVHEIIKRGTTSWEKPEWGFPKGRRNFKEKELACALREYQEETGYSKNTLNIITNIAPYEEIFMGSNYKTYKHTYFIAWSHFSKPESSYQQSEVSELRWVTYDEAVQLIRPYNIERIKLMHQVHESLNKYVLF